ncbi:MAG: hypothetical protein FWC58_03790 [Desulfobulbus sp.]|nr:hypothetical protein [Desulfobulbus sp.]
MATPSDDVYACPLNGAVAAGRSLLPDWVPAIGEIVDVSLNTLWDVRSTEANAAMQQQVDAWAGASFAKTHGEAGSLIFHTGGHTYFDSNAVYIYDIASRKWSQERPPAKQFLDAENYIGDVVTGWMWASAGGIGLQVGEPFAAHTYAWLTWIPPGVLPGGANGFLYTPGRGSMSQPGQKGTQQPHKYAIGSKEPWTFGGSPLSIRPAHSFAFFDELRRRVVYGYGDAISRNLYWVDPSTSAAGTITWPVEDAGMQPYYHVGFHALADDLYLSVRLTASGLEFNVIDPVAGRRYRPPTLGTAPTGPYPLGDCGVEWVEKWRSMVCFAGTDTVWTLTAPADPRTGAWQWSSQPLAGTARQFVTPPFTKFRYIPRLDMFIWPMTHNTPVQGFRIFPP